MPYLLHKLDWYAVDLTRVRASIFSNYLLSSVHGIQVKDANACWEAPTMGVLEGTSVISKHFHCLLGATSGGAAVFDSISPKNTLVPKQMVKSTHNKTPCRTDTQRQDHWWLGEDISKQANALCCISPTTVLSMLDKTQLILCTVA